MLIYLLLIGAGGPDGYGYCYMSTQDGDPILFVWEDITQTGVELELGDDDTTCINLPFEFPFYDGLYNFVVIGSNGIFYFDNLYVGMGNSCLPTDNYGVGDLIAAFWDDLNPEDTLSKIYYDFLPDHVVFEFYNVPTCSGSGRNTFQVVLTPGGTIELRFLRVKSYQDATIGIQDRLALNGKNWFLEYVCQGEPEHHVPGDSTLVIFTPPWVKERETALTRNFNPSSISRVIIGNRIYHVSIYSTCNDVVDLYLLTLNGREIATIRGVSVTKGENTIPLPNAELLPSGFYTISLKGSMLNQKFCLLHIR